MFSALAFIFLQRTGLYPPELPSVNLDMDAVYRKFLPWIIGGVGQVVSLARSGVIDAGKSLVGLVIAMLHLGHGPKGMAARTSLTSTGVAIVVLLLAALLLVNFLRG